MARNARFWIWQNGSPVKLTLRPDAPRLCHYEYHQTDEGWESSTNWYWLENGRVYRDWENDGRDCDGRLTSYGLNSCSIDRLASRHVGTCPLCKNYRTYTDGARTYTMGEKPIQFCARCEDFIPLRFDEHYPDWVDEELSQRDEYAEAMGY